MVALNLPAVEIAVHQSLQTQLQIGAEEEGGLTIEYPGTLPEPAAQRLNHHKLEGKIGAPFSPLQRAQNLHGNFAELTDGEGGRTVMSIKRYKPEQIVTLLRQIEVGIANGKNTPPACKEAEITQQTYYRWRKEYGGLKVDQAKRLKELERENTKLKRLVAELSLEKQVLKDVVEGNF